MKKLFIIVSIAAIAYLTAQTDIVKNAWNTLFLDDAALSTPVSEVKQIASVELASLRQENKHLLARINGLENQLKQVRLANVSDVGSNEALLPQQKPEHLKPEHLKPEHLKPEHPSMVDELSTIDAKFSHLNSQTADSAATDDQLITQNTVKNHPIDKDLQAHQKRLKQQAILRQVAKKMELAALQSLR